MSREDLSPLDQIVKIAKIEPSKLSTEDVTTFNSLGKLHIPSLSLKDFEALLFSILDRGNWQVLPTLFEYRTSFIDEVDAMTESPLDYAATKKLFNGNDFVKSAVLLLAFGAQWRVANESRHHHFLGMVYEKDKQTEEQERSIGVQQYDRYLNSERKLYDNRNLLERYLTDHRADPSIVRTLFEFVVLEACKFNFPRVIQAICRFRYNIKANLQLGISRDNMDSKESSTLEEAIADAKEHIMRDQESQVRASAQAKIENLIDEKQFNNSSRKDRQEELKHSIHHGWLSLNDYYHPTYGLTFLDFAIEYGSGNALTALLQAGINPLRPTRMEEGFDEAPTLPLQRAKEKLERAQSQAEQETYTQIVAVLFKVTPQQMHSSSSTTTQSTSATEDKKPVEASVQDQAVTKYKSNIFVALHNNRAPLTPILFKGWIDKFTNELKLEKSEHPKWVKILIDATLDLIAEKNKKHKNKYTNDPAKLNKLWADYSATSNNSSGPEPEQSFNLH